MATVITTEPTPDDEQLLPMQEYVERFLTNGSYELRHDEDEGCTICAEPLLARDERDKKRPYVKLHACPHLFHANCILRNLKGTYPTRNLCPNCRVPICKLGILSAEQVATLEAKEEREYWKGESKWNAELYARMMHMTDTYVKLEQTSPMGPEDWVALITYVRKQWIFQVSDKVWVCNSHTRYTWAWFDHHVAKRIQTHLFDMGSDLEDTRERQLFRCYYIALENSLENCRRPDLMSDSEDDTSDDQQSSNCGSPPRHDTAGTSTVEMDEAMHDTDTLNESPGSQSHEDLENEIYADSEVPRPSNGEYDGDDEQQYSRTVSISRHDTPEEPTAAADKNEVMQDSGTSGESPESQAPVDPTLQDGNERPSQGPEH